RRLAAIAAPSLLPLAAPWAIFAAAPVLLAWVVSPAVAHFVSRPRVRREESLTEQGTAELRRIARRTWGFFETCVGPEDNWLPPDNYQEDPKGGIAHRTSPTNIGLLLLSTLRAHDLRHLTLRPLTHHVRTPPAT